MPVYWSLFAWTCFVALTYKKWFLVRVTTIGGRTEAKPIFLSYFFSFIPLIVLTGLRGNFSDTPGYIQSFEQLPTDFSQILSLEMKDKLFYQLAAVIKIIFPEVHVWFTLLAVFQIVCLCITMRMYSEMPGISMFFFVASTGFSYMFNGIRQFVAIMILFAGYRLLVQKKYVWYILLIVLAAQFHGTAYIMVIGLVASFIRPWSKLSFVSIGAFTASMVFLEPILSQMKIFLEDTEYSGQINRLTELEGVNFIRVLVAVVPCVIGFVFRNSPALKGNREYKIAFNMAMLNVAFLTAASIVGGNLMARLAAYFQYYLILVYPILFKRCFREGTERSVAVAVFAVLYTAWFWFQLRVTWDGRYVSEILGLNY